jgi:hypothetical protein
MANTRKRSFARNTFKAFLAIFLVFLLACTEEEKDDDEGQEDPGFRFVEISYSGLVHKGPAYKLGRVELYPVSETWAQIGPPLLSYTGDLGRYAVKGVLNGDYIESFFEGYAYNELNNQSEFQRLKATVKSTDTEKNINPLTTVRSIVAEDLFVKEFGTIEECLLEAEKRILAYIEKPETGKKFTEMSLENTGLHDAVLTLFNSMVLYGRTPAEQGDYLSSIATGVINSDSDLKTEILETFDLLQIMVIKNNLESHYESFDLDMTVAPIWRLGYPEYYADLLEREEVVQYSFNLGDSDGCSSDTPGYTTFAIPHVFDASADSSKYIALNFDGDISIWTRTFDVYDRPGVKVFDIEELREIIIEEPEKMAYNGLLGGALTAGEYYIVISRDSPLSTGCAGGLLPFGRKLASNDGGASWIGFDNNTPWYRNSGVRMFTTD